MVIQDPTTAATDPGAQALYKLLAEFAPGLVPYAILGWIVITRLRAIAVAADKLPNLDQRLDKIESALRELTQETKTHLGRIHTDVVSLDGRVSRLEGRSTQKTSEGQSSWLLMGSDPLNLKGDVK